MRQRGQPLKAAGGVIEFGGIKEGRTGNLWGFRMNACRKPSMALPGMNTPG